MMQLAMERICGVNDTRAPAAPAASSSLALQAQQQCMADLHVRTTVVLFSDVHYPSDAMKAQRITKFPSLIELEDLLGFPEALYFHMNVDRPAKWITIGNRVLSYEGLIRDKIVRGVQFLRDAVYQPRDRVFPFGGVPPRDTRLLRKFAERQLALDSRVAVLPPPERPKLEPAILLAVRQRAVSGGGAWVVGSRNRGVDEHFKTALIAGLPNVTGRPVHVQDSSAVKQFGSLRFREQLAFMMARSFFVADEGAQLTWIALTNPGTTWITVYDYTPGMWTNNIRYHIRTWLIRRDCRFIVYLITNEDEQAGVDALLREVAAGAGASFHAEIVVISHDGVKRCHTVETCANALDFSLVVEMRGMYPLGV
jgi:hypothetical protein